MRVIKAQDEGQGGATSSSDERPRDSNVVDLMERLRASLDAAQAQRRRRVDERRSAAGGAPGVTEITEYDGANGVQHGGDGVNGGSENL